MRTLFVLAVSFFVAGCGGLRAVDSAESGKTYSYRPGTPNFDLEAVESVRDDTSGVDVYVRIPLGSLVFMRDSSAFAARYDLRLRILSESHDETIVDQSWMDVGAGSEPIVRLIADGKPMAALPRDTFLTAFHLALHDLAPDKHP